MQLITFKSGLKERNVNSLIQYDAQCCLSSSGMLRTGVSDSSYGIGKVVAIFQYQHLSIESRSRMGGKRGFKVMGLSQHCLIRFLQQQYMPINALQPLITGEFIRPGGFGDINLPLSIQVRLWLQTHGQF